MSDLLLKVLDSSTATMIAGLIAGMLGILSSVFLSRIQRMREFEIERLKEVQATLKAKMEETQSSSIAQISRELPSGLSSEELIGRISQIVKASISDIATKTGKDSLGFVSELVTGYHQQALSQARVQFWFSIVAATVGFAYILFAATRTMDGSFNVTLNVLPGVVIDAVALLFFKQAEQTRERATALYDRLRQDSQIENAREIVESINDVHVRSLVKAQIALHMAGLNPKELDLQSRNKQVSDE